MCPQLIGLSAHLLFILFFAHLFVPLTSSKVLSFERKKQKMGSFILFFAHLFVPLHGC